ncbi:MAG TPA: DUF3124 domain-containing protein [Polyangiales bacterium]|nr:DUF3124 domain-containing protein [Polyangiales bacterium]
MVDDHKHPDWLLWLSKNGVRILILAAVVYVAVVYLRTRTDTEERLHAIEDRIEYEAPREYTPPNLEAYAARGVDVATLDVHRADFVPVYSHIYHDGGRPYLLETTLSIHNIDPKHPIYVKTVDYYDTEGNLARTYLDRLIALKPLQTIEFLVERRDSRGGSGANFIIEWYAATDKAHAPLIEAVMVGRSGTNAIAFISKSEPLPQWLAE